MWGCNKDAAAGLVTVVQVWKNYFILQCGPHLMRSQPRLVSTTKLAGLPTAVLRLEERGCTRAAWCVWGWGRAEGSRR